MNLISAHEAWSRVQAHVTRQARIDLPLPDARGTWLAKPVCAERDLPPADRSAMDGFAIRAADSECERLIVTDEVAAGADLDPASRAGTCVRIYTGANVPSAYDTVVPVEVTSQASFSRDMDAEITLNKPVKPKAHIFRRGENATRGQELLSVGTYLGPAQIGVCAGAGMASVPVFKKPTVAVLTTGAELVGADGPVAPHQTRDSNGPTLLAALAEHGFTVGLYTLVPDDLAATRETIAEALKVADVIIVTGGVSAGRHDYVPDAVATFAEINYHGVAIKPGKPQLFAVTDDNKLIFGLPGNPLSSLTGLHDFVLPAMRMMSGCPAEQARPVIRLPLAEPLKARAERQHYALATMKSDASGMRIYPVKNRGSADLVAGGQANGTAILPLGDETYPEGAVVDFRPWMVLL